MGPAYLVPVGSNQIFTVGIQGAETSIWRIPVVYAAGSDPKDDWIGTIKSLLGMVETGESWMTNTADMSGLPDGSP